MVEHRLAKARVASSNLVFRSILIYKPSRIAGFFTCYLVFGVQLWYDMMHDILRLRGERIREIYGTFLKGPMKYDNNGYTAMYWLLVDLADVAPNFIRRIQYK